MLATKKDERLSAVKWFRTTPTYTFLQIKKWQFQLGTKFLSEFISFSKRRRKVISALKNLAILKNLENRRHLKF